MLLIIPHITMTALRAIHIRPMLHLLAHPLHVFRVHRIEGASDSQRGNDDLMQILRPVPLDQPAPRLELTGPLHTHIDPLAQMLETPYHRIRPGHYPA